jgi:hypothetical protein
MSLDETGPGILWFVRHNHWQAARGATRWTGAKPS